MATPFDQTPKWFDAEYYLGGKVVQLIAAEPEANWNRDAVVKAFNEAGFSNPYDHYLAVGDTEGLNPNQFFNADQYVAAKMAQLGTSYTKEMVVEAIHSMGITVAQHYEMFGYGEGLNPSQSFSNTKYFEAKAEELNRADAAGAWTADKVKAAIDDLGITPMDHYFMFGKAEGLGKYDFSENGQPIPKPGKLDIKLTLGDDVVSPTSENADLKTTDRDDVISGSVLVSSTKSTLNAKDVIDGGAGTDTLKVDLQGHFSTGFKDGGSVKNVEIIALENITGTRTFNAKGIESAREYTMSLGGNTMTINDVDSAGTSFSLQAGENAALNVRYQDTALTGRNDNAYVGLYNVGEDTGAASLNFAAAKAGKVEGISLYSSGKSNFVDVTSQHETVTVRGGADIDVAIAGGATAFDASMATGVVYADLTASIGSLKTIAGGFGDDTLEFGNSNASGASQKIAQTISGFETLVINDAGTGVTAYTIDMANITGLDTIKYETAVAGADTIEVKNSGLSEFNFEIKDSLSGVANTFTYGGAGALNVNLYGDAGTDDTFGTITADKISTLNISNNAEAGKFTITNISAKAATAMNIDAGNNGGFSLTGTALDLAKLETIKATGDAQVSITTSDTEVSLTTIDAGALNGNLTLDLEDTTLAGDGTRGVEILVGKAGSDIKGTKGNDTITFGDGEDLFTFGATLALNGKDSFSTVGTNDEFNVNALTGDTVATMTLVAAGAAKSSTAVDTSTTVLVFADGRAAAASSAVVISDFTNTDQVAKYILSYHDTMTASKDGAFVINDVQSNMAYVYHFDNGSDATITATELTLVGVVTDGLLGTSNIA